MHAGDEPIAASLFSGIGGMDEGIRRAGFGHAFLCESDGWRRGVLAERFPGVPVYEDVRAVGVEPAPRAAADGRVPGADGAGRVHADALPRADLLCGGFPCQDLSVAGRRAGLAGERSGLFFEFARVAEALRPGWLLVENVPGLLSSQGGRDFGLVLGTLAELGYGLAWRVLDSRFFGVPQRRRRVFIVGALASGDPRAAAERAAEVLAVGARCERHPPAGAEAGQDVALALGGGAGAAGWRGADHANYVSGPLLSGDADQRGYRVGAEEAGTLVTGSLNARDAVHNGQDDDGSKLVVVASTLKGQRGKGGGGIGPEETLIAGPLDTRQTPAGHGMAGVNDQAAASNHIVAVDTLNQTVDADVFPTLRDPHGTFGDGLPAVAAPLSHGSNPNSNAAGRRREDDVNLVAGPLGGGNDGAGRRSEDDPNLVAYALRKDPGGTGQGHNTNYAQHASVRRLTPRECERLQALPDDWTLVPDSAPDSRRYAALGDAVTASVAEFIARRILAAERGDL